MLDGKYIYPGTGSGGKFYCKQHIRLRTIACSFHRSINRRLPDSWSWDFGNGQLSTQQNPTITYSQPGTYTVRLIVKNASGIDDEIKTDYITVFASPSASFTADLTTACAPAAVQFTDHSTSPPGSSVTSWQWDFGDGGTSTQQNPSHTYTNTGFYSVTLQITNSNGCKRAASIGRYIRIVRRSKC